MGVGFFLINLLIMPFLQLTLTMSGGMFVTVAMVAFALSAYTLKFKMPKNAFAITCGATALVLALVWDIENFHLNSKQFWLLMFGHLLAVGFVFMLGIHSDRIFNRMTEKTGVANEE